MGEVMTPQPGKVGRPTKYTPKTVKGICDALELGATHKDACAANGISAETFCQWIKEFPEFSEAVTRAEGACALKMAAKMVEAATRAENSDWRAAESWLKRRRRDEWGDSVSVGADKEVRAIIAQLLASCGEGGTGSPEVDTGADTVG